MLNMTISGDGAYEGVTQGKGGEEVVPLSESTAALVRRERDIRVQRLLAQAM